MQSVQAPAAIVQSVPASVGPIDTVEQWIRSYDKVYGFRQLYTDARLSHSDTFLARQGFACDLRIALALAVREEPVPTALVDAIARLRDVDWLNLADSLADEIDL